MGLTTVTVPDTADDCGGAGDDSIGTTTYISSQ